MASPKATMKMKLKLMIDKTKNKVVFAEADKAFVDFLLHMLALPVAAILSITTNAASAGGDPAFNAACFCFGNLYHALANMHRQTNSVLPSTGALLLNPTAPITSGTSGSTLSLLLPITGGSKLKASSTAQHYRCPGNKYVHKCRVYVADDPAATCPECDSLMTEELIPVESGKVWSGYVKDILFMVMDDLEVKPLNVTSVVALLKNLDAVEERMVDIGTDEGVKLLKAAMESKGSALTDVFLNAVKEEGGDGDGDGLSTINYLSLRP